ncbi:hypothetical protein D3C81_1618470 [compost metagenome]
MAKFALPFRVSTSAFWLLPVAVRSLVRVSRPLTGGVCSLPSVLMKCSTGTRWILVFTPSCGTAGRTSTVPLASKVPLYSSPRRVCRVSRPPWPTALSWALSIGSLSRVNEPKARSACRSRARRRSTGSSLSSLHATCVGALGSGVVPAPATALASCCLTSAWRAAVAPLASSLLAGR